MNIKYPICFAFFFMAILSACTKKTVLIIPVVSFSIKGRLDASKTTLTTASVNKALFTLSYSKINDSVETNAVLNGNLIIYNYIGITNRDTLLFFAPKTIGVDTAIVVANDSIRRTTISANNFSFYNGDTARFMCTNFPIQNFVSTSLKAGKGFFRVGRYPKYVFVKMDSITKL